MAMTLQIGVHPHYSIPCLLAILTVRTHAACTYFGLAVRTLFKPLPSL